MASRLPVWGIDVGQFSLKAVKLQAAGDHVEMLAVDVVSHESILSQSESNAPEMIGKAIETFLSRNDLKESLVAVSVPGQQTLTRFTKMPPVEPKKIPDMVHYEASQQIPFDMDEVVWDYQVLAEEDSPDVEVGIFAIRKELIRNHLSHFMERGIEPMIVQTSPMASYNAARFEWPPDEGRATILLDMGALATDLIVFEGNRIWSRPVPIGGNRFTEALVSAFKISFRKAERLKRSAASSKYARQVFQAMRPVFADLVSEVQRSIGFYTSTHREARMGRLLGMGNAFKLPGLQKFLQQNLQIKVEKITGFKKMKSLATERSSEYADNVMSFGVAYGLALQGLGLAAVGANLLPLEVRRRLLWQKKRVWFAGAAACLALAAGSLWVGNVMADNQLAKGMGNLTGLRPRPPASIEQAEQMVRAGAGEAPLERAVKVAGAAQKLEQEYNRVSAQSGGDERILKEMAKLPKNNVMVPRIIDVIHRAFGEAAEEEVRGVASARDYLALAGRIPRQQRKEFWIRGLAMDYSTNPMKRLDEGKDTNRRRLARPGWFVTIVGQTTAPNAPKLIDEKLITVLDRLGKEPDRGIYFAKVTLAGVKRVSETGEDDLAKLLLEDTKQKRGASRRRQTVRGGRRASRDTGGGLFAGPFGSKGGGRRPGGAPSGEAANLAKWKEKFKTQDPLTGETTSADQQFVIQIVVHKGNTPKKLIPEEYKEKKGEDAKASGTDS